jgi:hypothetical protein
LRLIAPNEHAAFNEMLAHELRSFREPLPADELRHIAVNTWRAFCKYGWPANHAGMKLAYSAACDIILAWKPLAAVSAKLNTGHASHALKLNPPFIR